MENIYDDLWGDPVDPAEGAQELDQPYLEFNPEDESLYGDPAVEPEPGEKPAEKTPAEVSYLDRLLRARGVDRQRVRIENEDGEIEEWKFDDLDEDTKFGILNEQESPLTDEEMEDLNFLRNNKMNLKDFIAYQKQEAVKEYLKQNQEVSYTVDQVSDDDLFKFDLLDQMPDLTQEEVEDQLARAKESPSYFEKKVAALRAEYKKLEDEQEQAKEAEARAREEEAFNQLAGSLVDVARKTDEMDGMVLDDDDKEDVLSFILDLDANGQSQFYKLFEDPATLFKIAWYALKGEEANTAKENYFKSEIAKARRSAKSNQPQTPQQRTVRRAPKKSQDPDDSLYGLDSVFKS